MNKPAKPETDGREDLDEVLGPTPTEAATDLWYARNREVIIQLVEEGFAEIERGEFDERSFAEIIADGVQSRAKR